MAGDDDAASPGGAPEFLLADKAWHPSLGTSVTTQPPDHGKSRSCQTFIVTPKLPTPGLHAATIPCVSIAERADASATRCSRGE